MTRLRVTHLATGRTLIGSSDELLDWLAGWWPDEDPDDAAIYSIITQAVYGWEQGRFGATPDQRLGIRAELL